MNSTFNVCNYNLGMDKRDWCEHHFYHKPDFEEDENTNKKYLETQEIAANSLLGTADVFCLQEGINADRPIVRQLLADNFKLYRLEGEHKQCKELVDKENCDTAILLNPKRFKDMTNHSFAVNFRKSTNEQESKDRTYRDVTIVTATDVTTNQRILFVSAHIIGFFYSGKKAKREQQMIEGDSMCQQIAQRIEEIQKKEKCAVQFFCADMNGDPEISPKRFKIFSKKGFKSFDFGYTNVSGNELPRERKLDYIFSKAKSTGMLSSLFFKNKQYKSSVVKENYLGNEQSSWDVNKNPSDHLPVHLKFTTTIKPCGFSRLWSAICRLASRCFGC